MLAKFLAQSSSFVSMVVALKGETRPSKIIAILNLSIASMFSNAHAQLFTVLTNLSSQDVVWLKDIFGFNPFVRQSTPIEDDAEEVQWTKHLPNLLGNWNCLKSSPAFKKISALISIMATMGFIDSSKLNLDIKGIRLISLGSLRRHADATDLITAFLDTLNFLFEGGYAYFKDGNAAKFLFEDPEAFVFDKNYLIILEASQHAATMNLETIPMVIDGKTRILCDEEYRKLLESTIEQAKKCRTKCTSPWQTSYFVSRLERLVVLRASFDAMRSNGKMREAPFSTWLYGTSGVGKTTLGQIVMTTLLANAGVPTDKLRNIAVINEMDEYDSTITGDKLGYLFDDVGNTKPEFIKKAPTQKIIDFDNNSPMFAVKADLEGKGKTPIKPKVTLYTSNREVSSVAKTYSQEPFSIVRRMKVIVEVMVKPEFCISSTDKRLDSQKVFDKFGEDSGPVVDIWELFIYTANEQHGVVKVGPGPNYNTANGDYKHDLKSFMTYLYKLHDKHMIEQKTVVNIADQLIGHLNFCDCGKIPQHCSCPVADSEFMSPELFNNVDAVNQSGDDDIHITPFDYNSLEFTEFDADESLHFEYPAAPSTLRAFMGIGPRAQMNVARAHFDELTDGLEYYPVMLLNYGDILLRRFAHTDIIQRVYWSLNCPAFTDFIRKLTAFALMCFGSYTSLCFSIFPRSSACSLTLVGFLTMIHVVIMYAVQWHRDRLRVVNQVYQGTRHIVKQIKAKHILTATALFTSMVALISVLRAINTMMSFQSVLEPISVQELKERDAKVDPWCIPFVSELHCLEKGQTSTHEEVVSNVERNLYHGVYCDGISNQKCDLLIIRGNVGILPLHIFEKCNEFSCLFTRGRAGELSASTRCNVSLLQGATINGQDVALVSVPGLGPHKDITRYFPEVCKLVRTATTFLYRNEDGTMRTARIATTYTEDSGAGGPGYTYNLPFKTFNGLCMGVLVADAKHSCIQGVHLRGITGKTDGVALTITQDMIQALLAGSHTWKGAFISHSNGNFPTSRYGIDFTPKPTIHANSPLNFMPVGSNIDYLGQVPGRSSHTKTSVKQTSISPIVEEVTGVPNTWAGPRFECKRNWQASMSQSANPSPGISGKLLEQSFVDYVEPIVETFNSEEFNSWTHSELKPLDDMESIAGRDNARFIDAMKKTTSKGFPLTGPKKDWINNLDPNLFPEHNCPIEIREEVWDVVAEMEAALLDDKRCYTVFKACLKDEPTPIGKDKVRVFQAADWAFQIMTRKYYLPIARMFAMFPKLTECAVGVNAHGPEWENLAKHMSSNGKDRIFAGDYGKYDLRMPAQIVLAAFEVMMEVGRRCGQYTDDDIKIMRGIATEIAYSCVAYNGDMVIHKGSSPSGHSLTVFINSIGGSLLVRSGFFGLWPKKYHSPMSFRLIVHLMTYGDDVKGSVRKGFDWFNHISYANFMKSKDIVFTMPDKTSTPTPYMTDQDADFLKRKNVFCPETNHIHGALDEKSIFKSLHSVLDSTVGMDIHCAGNLDCALGEWFHHGRTVFDMRHKQMVEVASRAGIDTLCNSLELSYDDRVDAWKKQYLS